MTITLYTKILSGNLGDGWNNNNAVADALADYTERTWRADLAELLDEGHECLFHANWTPIPAQAGHPFHANLDSRSEATRGVDAVYAGVGSSVNFG